MLAKLSPVALKATYRLSIPSIAHLLVKLHLHTQQLQQSYLSIVVPIMVYLTTFGESLEKQKESQHCTTGKMSVWLRLYRVIKT